MSEENLLEIRNLTVQFPSGERYVNAVNGVNLSIREGETLGIVGESGCGKSVSLFSILKLLPPQARVNGEILFDGKDLLKISMDEMRGLRGKDISIIFQEPMTSLNPVLKISTQIVETIMLHEKVGRKVAFRKAVELLRLVELPDPERRLDSYPHQLSGGMRQRVMIAMALACKPRILLADEPTTALDVTIQAQILDLMQRLKEEYGMSIAIVTHDLGVIAEVAQRIAVFYAGQVLEVSETKELFDIPLHPYTEGLLGCIPTMGSNSEYLNVIKGMIPNPLQRPPGCAFHPRCQYMRDICKETPPQMVDIREGHSVACHLARERADAYETRGDAT